MMPDSWASSVVAEMTLAEKIGQMTQVSNESISPPEIADFFIGSVLSGGNGNPTPNAPSVWADMVASFADAARDTRLGVPMLYGVDAVHGHCNVEGATVFPHNIGLGAVGDEDLVTRIGRVTATEMLATGIRWTFAPTVAVARDIRWGRTYESYGRNPDLVSRLGGALITGLQGNGGTDAGVAACAKHFVGDGATSWGSVSRSEWVHWWDGWGDTWQIDQGDARITEAELRAIHLRPYVTAVDAGVMTVMASYSSWNGAKLHGHRGLLSDVLKLELGFDGFVISDWMGIDQIASSYDDAVVAAITAGIDMVMVPDDFRQFIDAMTRAAASGSIPMRRIDDAVRRILTVKSRARLTDTHVDVPPQSVIGSPAHRALAAEAVRRSAVLLSNDGALPIPATLQTVDVAGRAADDIGLQCGGWTVGWQGGIGRTTPGTTLLDGLRAARRWEVRYDATGRFPDHEPGDIGIVCIAEPPYAEGPGDRAVPTADGTDRAVFAAMRERTDTLVLVVYSGRPLLIPDLIDQADAVIAAWLPGTEAAALADLLTGTQSFEGRTPQPWPRSTAAFEQPEANPLYPTGHGLTLESSPDGPPDATPLPPTQP